MPGLSLQEEQTRNLMTVEYGPSVEGQLCSLGGFRAWFASNQGQSHL